MHELIHWKPVFEEFRDIHVVHRHHVVIAVDELFRKSRNLVQVHLYCSAVESRKKTFWNHVFMQDYMNFALVNPFRDLLYV